MLACLYMRMHLLLLPAGFRVWQLTAYDGKQVIVSVKEDMGNNWTKANAFIIALAQVGCKPSVQHSCCIWYVVC